MPKNIHQDKTIYATGLKHGTDKYTKMIGKGEDWMES